MSEAVDKIIAEMKYKEPIRERQLSTSQYNKIVNALRAKKAKKETFKRLANKAILKKQTRPTVRLRSSRQPQEYKSIYFKV